MLLVYWQNDNILEIEYSHSTIAVVDLLSPTFKHNQEPKKIKSKQKRSSYSDQPGENISNFRHTFTDIKIHARSNMCRKRGLEYCKSAEFNSVFA